MLVSGGGGSLHSFVTLMWLTKDKLTILISWTSRFPLAADDSIIGQGSWFANHIPLKIFPCIYIMKTWISSPFIDQNKQITLVLLAFKSKLLLLVIHVKRLILPQKSLNDCFTIPRINACYVHVHAWKLYLIIPIIIHLLIH